MSNIIWKTTSIMSARKTKPLSATPLGYLLAVLGGIPAGIVGCFLSPAVLFLLNIGMPQKEGASPPNRFLIWFIAGVVIVPISLSIQTYNSSSSKKSNNTGESKTAEVSPSAQKPIENPVPAGWSSTGKKGIYWKWCSSGECNTSKVIGDNSYALMQVWCKEVACGNIYGRVNLLDDNDVVIGWTNDTGYGDAGQVVQLTFDSFQTFKTVRLTELNFN